MPSTLIGGSGDTKKRHLEFSHRRDAKNVKLFGACFSYTPASRPRVGVYSLCFFPATLYVRIVFIDIFVDAKQVGSPRGRPGSREKMIYTENEGQIKRAAVKLPDFLLIFCLCIIVYANSFGVDWISDDIRFITGNPAVKDLSNASRFFTDPHGTTAPTSGFEGIYRPLRTLSFAIDYSIWGLRPFGFHLTNLLLHFVSSALVFLVCMQLNGHRASSLTAALVFAVHPAQVETVTWIASRADIMATVFILTSFFLYAQQREKIRLPAFLGSLVFFILGLLSKETAIIFPILLIAFDVLLPSGHNLSRRSQLLRHFAFIAIAVVYFLVRAHMLQTISQREYWGGSFFVTIFTMAKCFLIYLRLVFLPRAINCMDYLVPFAKFPPGVGSVAPFVFFWVFVVWTLLAWRLSPVAGFGFAWFLIALAPVSNVFPISRLMAERFLYIPMVGICLAGATLFEAAIKSGEALRQRLVTGALCAMLLLLGLSTIAKNSAWLDPEILYMQNLRLYPVNYQARLGLAGIYEERGENLESIKQYEHAIRISPKPRALHNLGNLYLKIGDIRSAIAMFKIALVQNPDPSWTLNSLGAAYLAQGKIDRAVREFQRAIESDETFAPAHFSLAIALEKKGEIKAALIEYRATVALNPDHEEAHRRIAGIESQIRSR